MKRRWDALIAVAFALILLVVEVADFQGEMRRLAQEVTTLRQQGAFQSLAKLDSWLLERSVGLSALAGTLALMPEKRVKQGLDHLASLSGDMENTYVGFSDGTWAIPGQWTPPRDYKVQDRPWFAGAFSHDGVHITKPYRDLRTNRQVVAFSKSFTTVNGERATVATVVPVARIRDLLQIGQRDYSVTVGSGTTTIAAVLRGDPDKLTSASSSAMTNGWRATYRTSEQPDPNLVSALIMRRLGRWFVEMVILLAAWLAANGFVKRTVAGAVKNLKGIRKVPLQVPTILSDLPAAVVSLSQDIAAFPEVLLQMLSLKDDYTARHARNVAELAVATGQRLGLPKEAISELHFAGILHDIGKVGIPDHLLHKPGALTDEEWTEMKKHPVVGGGIARKAGIKPEIVEAIGDHHERLDGSGYPRGCAGADLGLLARIIAVADVYDAMTSDRPYRTALTPAEAFRYLGDEARFDQRVVDSLYAAIVEQGPDPSVMAARVATDSEVWASPRLTLG